MRNPEITTQQLIAQLKSQSEQQSLVMPVDTPGRLRPYTEVEAARVQADKLRAQKEEAARWAANTVLLAQDQITDNVISITEAPSYSAPLHSASEPGAQQAQQ